VGYWASCDYTEEIARTQYNSEKRISAIEATVQNRILSDIAWSHRTMKATGMEDNSEVKPLAQIERHSEVGWISRQNLLALRSRENFFLTSLLIELIEVNECV